MLIINNLAASMLWHRLNVLDPPKILLRHIQKIYVDFFGDGHHWLPPAILFLPVNEGGQGLIDLADKVKAMRLKVAQTLLYVRELSIQWVSFGLALLRTFGVFSLDKQLFLMSQYSWNFIFDVKFCVSVLNPYF